MKQLIDKTGCSPLQITKQSRLSQSACDTEDTLLIHTEESNMKPLFVFSGWFVFTVKMYLFNGQLFLSVLQSWNRCRTDQKQLYWFLLHMPYNQLVTH